MNTFIICLIKNTSKLFFYSACFFVLQSCSPSLVGRKLADSFDAPLDSDQTVNSSEKKTSQKTDSLKKTVQNKENINQANSVLPKPKSSFSSNTNQRKDTSRKTTNFVPQTYRIIIRLPGVNPSAPSETVTTALRKAGVMFEVEKIERVDNSSSR